MNMITTPTDRRIIWIRGIIGNEGKSWFQDYVAAFYDYQRVVQLDLNMGSGDVLHALSKRPLSSVDIFLFNQPRATEVDLLNYGLLESIKDGSAMSSKYSSDVLRFKIPNIVIVFSNKPPITTRLSQDRWSVFVIKKTGCLKDITDRLWKKQIIERPMVRTKTGRGIHSDDEELEVICF